MNPESKTRTLTDAERFDLLEHPELWPDDPAIQAELAELLELHLGLQAHGSDLGASLQVLRPKRFHRSSWFLAAAATLLAVAPTTYALQQGRALRRQAQDTARIEANAQHKGQNRLWGSFFQQSSELIQRFEQSPPLCNKDHEDRNEERVLAMALLEASRQLAGQTAPVANSQAEIARNELHFWLTELSLEDGCLTPERAQELRRLASTQDLEGQAQRLSALLKGEGS
ncbi:MAG: hypothetical protein Q8O00_04550 [Holophaga sp.]|nr:hypothetical protein [Holophaga sp.]